MILLNTWDWVENLRYGELKYKIEVTTVCTSELILRLGKLMSTQVNVDKQNISELWYIHYLLV